MTSSPSPAGDSPRLSGPRAHVLHEANYAQLLTRARMSPCCRGGRPRPTTGTCPTARMLLRRYRSPNARGSRRRLRGAGDRPPRDPLWQQCPAAGSGGHGPLLHRYGAGDPPRRDRQPCPPGDRPPRDRQRARGNDFKPMVRDCQLTSSLTIFVVDFWRLCPDVLAATFPDPGDHAGQLETSLLLHLRPEWVEMARAGRGRRRRGSPTVFAKRTPGRRAPGRRFSPTPAAAIRPGLRPLGARYFEAAAASLATLLTTVSGLDGGADVFG